MVVSWVGAKAASSEQWWAGKWAALMAAKMDDYWAVMKVYWLVEMLVSE